MYYAEKNTRAILGKILEPGVRKFWRIANEKANGKENFGKSDSRSSIISLYL